MNHELAPVAARQHGVFDARQAVDAGLSGSTLHYQVGLGRLLVLHPGVYTPAGSPATWERALMAATLAGGAGSVASHRSAGRLWGITDQADDSVEVTVPRRRCPRMEGVVVHRSLDLSPTHTARWRGFEVTKPARAILDLGAVLPRSAVEDALDRALVRRLITIAGVEWIHTELSRRGRRGAGVLGAILDERALGAQRPDGLLEPRMARLLKRAGLPSAVFQHVLRAADGRVVAVIDFAYPDLLLAIEVDGYAIHGTPRAMAKDFIRQNGLVPLRWHVLRFTWAQIVGTPEAVAASITAARTALAA